MFRRHAAPAAPRAFGAAARTGVTAHLALLLLVVGVLQGCSAGYSGRLDDVRRSIAASDLNAAEAKLSTLLDGSGQVAAAPNEDMPLLLLERASVRQALGQHEAAIADFTDADPMLELLDLTPDGAGSAAEYLFSDDAGIYKLPVYEKLMVNASAMLSYLSANDLPGALVEARRLTILIDYFNGTDLAGHPAIQAASLLAGLAFAAGGDPTGEKLIAESGLMPAGAETDEANDGKGLVFAVVCSGLAPYRRAERYPIGVVFDAVGRDSRYQLSQEQQAQMAKASAENLLTWVNYPVLVRYPASTSRFNASAGGFSAEATEIADLADFALAQWKSEESAIAWAALTRAITRIIAREAVQAVGDAAGGKNSSTATAFFVLSLITQGVMQAADTPDTRTWNMMPAGISLATLRLPVGEQQLTFNSSSGRSQSLTISARDDRPVVALFRTTE